MIKARSTASAQSATPRSSLTSERASQHCLWSMGRQVLEHRKTEYSWGDLLRYFAGGRKDDPRCFDATDTRTWIHDHTDCRLRLLEPEMHEREFLVVRRRLTPVRRLPAPGFNQERFLTVQSRRQS